MCTIRGAGPIEPATARRLSCTGTLLGAIVDNHGDVLALGRTRRLVSKRQRRALMVRDRLCQFPGCSRDKHLEAHHRIAWSQGGSTDLENLILLCRFHHTCVHEGGITISREPDIRYQGAGTSGSCWRFTLPDGQPIANSGWQMMSAQRLVWELQRQHQDLGVDHVDGYNHPDAKIIRTIGGGEGFDLHECVQALFSMTIDQDQQAA